MQNWYQKFIKISQTVTDETVIEEKINIVTNQLINDVFPKFSNEIGQATYNAIDRLIDEKINNYARDIPDILQLVNYNPEPMKDILRALASLSAGTVLKENQANIWNFINNQNRNLIQQYLTEFFRTVYSPAGEDLESLKLTMMKK